MDIIKLMENNKTATITAKLTPELKKEVELILNELGLGHSEVINLLYKQIYMTRSIPFEIKIPEKVKKIKRG